MNNLKQNLNNLIEILKKDQKNLEEISTNNTKSKLRKDELVGEKSFDNIKDFFLKNSDYDIEWIRSDLLKSGERRQKYDMDTLWQYCDFISYMISFGASKDQSINLLKEIIADTSTVFEFNSDINSSFIDFESFNGKRFFKGFNDILAFTNLAIKITKNKNIEDSASEKNFDDALITYKKIWKELAMRLAFVSYEYNISFDKEFPKNKITQIIRDDYKNPLDLLVLLKDLDEDSKEKYTLFLKRYLEI